MVQASQQKVTVWEGITPDNIPFDELFALDKPVILKGLVKDWPLVKTGQQGIFPAMQMLEDNYSQKPMLVYRAPASIKGRFGYNDNYTGFNFAAERSTIPSVLDIIRNELDKEEHEYLYVNSLILNEGFPALAASHSLAFNHPEFEQNQVLAKIWIGTESLAACHFDQPKNLACCVLGKRRFTLFPPNQIENLYPGPLHPTPGGQVVTIANLAEPDFEKFPRLKTALENAWIADLEPGDGLYYPSMWWHEVTAFERFNIMVNFWWMTTERYKGNPMDVLLNGMMSLRDKPEDEKRAWKALFDYYVFGEGEVVREHLPPECQGALGEMTEINARRLRAMLISNLNR